jgi:integrase
MALRDISTLMLQKYFSGLGSSPLGGHTILKLKEVLSSIMGSAMRYDLLSKNPVLAVQIPRAKVINKTRKKPHLTPEEFEQLLQLVSEPYATMIYIAVFSGLRISELIGLKWNDVHYNSLTVDERYCRGDWSKTKTSASAATVGVPDFVIARIQRLKTLEVEVNWGGKGAKKRFKLIRSDGPTDLVFQSVRTGAPMRDENILRRHPRPAALRLGLDPKKATWRSLRTSCATWMVEAGANPKDVQGQMRHSRIATTLDIYAQHVPESQERAVAKMVEMVAARRHAQFVQLKPDVVN